MTETTARIRWEDSLNAPGEPAFKGHASGLDDVFRIYPPEEPGDESWLSTWLPGLTERQLFGVPDHLKIEAERWLTEFIASLGAIFPDALREAVSIERTRRCKAAGTAPSYELQNRYWGRIDALDWVLALLDPEAERLAPEDRKD